MLGSITRRRTGCVVCRQRRVKCDESRPSCQNCIRNSKCCSWLKELRFIQENSKSTGSAKNSKVSRVSSTRKKTSRASRSQTFTAQGEVPNLGPPNDKFLSPTINNSASPQTSNHVRMTSSGSSNVLVKCPPNLSDQSTYPVSTVFTEGSNETDFDLVSSLDSVTEICRSESAKLRDSIAIEHASPIPPNLNPNPEGFTDWNALGISEELQNVLNSDFELILLHNYVSECAPWFDAHNSQRNYSKRDVFRMMNCPPWRAAALALSAKNMGLRKEGCSNSDAISLHLYQLAVRLAIDSISGRFDCVGTLAGCVLLAVYEMMTVSYTDWRRHLQGCASIYIHNDWNGSTGGLISASFWNYARIDIWAAFCSETDTLICPSIWFDKPREIMSLTDVDEDIHAQISTWLLGRTVNIVHRSLIPGPSILFNEVENLGEDLSKWEAMGSPACCALISRDANPDEDIPFPRILFSSHSSIIAHTMFHTAMVLFLEFKNGKSASTKSVASEAIYFHSRTACGIIGTNNHTPCLVNSLQPIWICGRHLRTKSEKLTALDILAQIEKRTGWKCDWRSSRLREIWELA